MLILRDIRPAEKRGALAAFYTIGGIMAGHELLETARDALFLASVPASRLPWVYLVIAMLGMAIARGPMGRLGRLFGTHVLTGLLVGAAIVTAGLWLVVDPSAPWSLYVTYIWSGLFATLVVLQFWNLIGRLYTSTDAKRVFRFVGLGAIVGAIAGSLQATLLATMLPARHLLLAAAATLLFAAPGSILLATTPPIPDRTRLLTIRECVHCMTEHRYTRRVAWMIFFATLSFTLVDYVFKSLVAAHVPSADLGTFFAVVNVALNLGSLLAQIVLSRWLLRLLGLHLTLALLPLLVLLGSLGVALGGALTAVLILKGVDGSLRHSVHRTATELLYVPLTTHVRVAAKELTDVAIQRGGQALASLGILVGVATLAVSDEALAAVAVCCTLAWLVFALSLRKPRQALVEIGDEAVPLLEQSLERSDTRAGIREHLPRTISRFDPGLAVAVLQQQLARRHDGVVRLKLLRGLGRLRADHPDLALDEQLLERVLVETIDSAFHWIRARSTLEQAALEVGSTRELLIALLADKERHAIEWCFRLLGLLVSDADVESIHRGLSSTDPRVQSSSRELIAAIAPSQVRGSLLALVDDVPDEQRLMGRSDAAPQSARELIEQMQESGSETLSAFARRLHLEMAEGHRAR